MTYPDFVERFRGNGVNRPELVRRMIRLRVPEPMSELAIAGLGRKALLARPECTLVDLVESWCEMQAQGRGEADIILAIVTRRRDILGDEPLPAQLDLHAYARYRMRLEHRDDPTLAEPAFVNAAVDIALERFRRTRPDGTVGRIGSSDREGRPAGMSVVVLYAILSGALILFPSILLASGAKAARHPFAPAFVVTSLAMMGSAYAYFAMRNWGRWALAAFMAACVILSWIALYPYGPKDGPTGKVVVLGAHSLVTLLCIRYLVGRKMRQVFS